MDSDASLGERIRSLRERAEMKSQELAGRIGLDPSAMSNIERGKRALKTDELGRIAAALRVSPMAILDPGSLPARMPVAPRNTGGATIDGPVYGRLLALTELHTLLEEDGLLTFPKLDDVPELGSASWLRSASALAAWATKRLSVTGAGDDRFSNLADAIENQLGVDVLVEDYPDGLAGAAITDRSFPLIFVNGNQTTPRALFTLAHELGHVLARHGEAITLDVDLVGRNESERLANAFAATFLMPETTIRRLINEHGRGAEALALMLYEFGVSFESLIYRLHNIGLINAEVRDQLRSVGWRGLVNALAGPELQARLPPELRKSLVARLGSRPERRPPGWLLERTREGYEKGTVSIRPLAGLLGADADSLIERPELVFSGSTDILDDGHLPHDDSEQMEDLFQGDPV